MRGSKVLSVLALAVSLSAQGLQLDKTRAFFSTTATGNVLTSNVVGIAATTNVGEITADTYLRYVGSRPGGRPGTRLLETLGFDYVLARECEVLGIARSAPTLAPAMATRRLLESHRSQLPEQGRLRARFATEALRRLRIDALVSAARQVDKAALKTLFDHRYGIDGVRVYVRHVLIRKRASALTDIRALHTRFLAGEHFAALLAKSEDRTTRRLLRDPKRATEAGFVEGYNYHRFGEAFADTVRALQVGGVSGPVSSAMGYHLIQLVDRKVTRLDSVEAALKKELGGGKATSYEIDALRRRLLEKYEFRPTANLATDPTDWPHYRGNPQLHGVAPGKLGSKPVLRWTFETEGEIISSPVIVDGVVYVGSTDNSVYAIDLESGDKKWSFETADMVEAPPLVLDGIVYIGSSDFFFYALDAASGELLWKFETMDKILGGANWFQALDGSIRIVVGSYDARLYCFSATDGKKLWSYETTNYVHGTPGVGDGVIVFGGCDAGLHLVDAETGERVARIDLGSGCQVAGSVAIAEGKAYFGHYGNEFMRVDLESGEIGWTYPSKREGFCSSPAIGDTFVVFGGRDKQMHCVLRKDGTPQWTFKTRRKIDGSAVICGDKVVFGSGDGRLYLLRLEDGEELWNYDIGKSVYSSPAVAGEMIVIGANDKRVYAFHAPAEQEK